MARIFVTGASGYIGSAFVGRALAAGYVVYGLTRSESGADRLRHAGAEPVIGDLAAPGTWLDRVRDCEFIAHLAQPETYGARVTLERARRYRDARLRMDHALL